MLVGRFPLWNPFLALDPREVELSLTNLLLKRLNLKGQILPQVIQRLGRDAWVAGSHHDVDWMTSPQLNINIASRLGVDEMEPKSRNTVHHGPLDVGEPVSPWKNVGLEDKLDEIGGIGRFQLGLDFKRNCTFLNQLLCLKESALQRTMKWCPDTIAFLYSNQLGSELVRQGPVLPLETSINPGPDCKA